MLLHYHLAARSALNRSADPAADPLTPARDRRPHPQKCESREL